jgi:predicted DNA-binding transcriptional regulator AlpA
VLSTKERSVAQRVKFDDLPDSAHVDDKTLAEVFGTSTTTIWRRAKQGTLPKPVRFSSRCTRWNVGDIRKNLAAHRGDDKG